MTILFDDKFLLIVHKPAGMPVQPMANKQQESMLCVLQKTYTDLHLINRVDQRVSGLVLLAKNAAVAKLLTQMSQNNNIEKYYRAVTKNALSAQQKSLTHYLLKNAKLSKSFSVDASNKNAKKSVLNYELLQKTDNYFLYNIQLVTGRFHQIRAQLAAEKSPIVGDVKYGFNRTLPTGNILLQAYRLCFEHPFTYAPIDISIDMPEDWKKFGFTS